MFPKRQSIEQVTRFVKHRGIKSGAASLVAVQPKGSKPPLFCIHGFRSYFYLARVLGADQPIYGLVQHTGQSRVPHVRIEDIAAHYIEEIQRIQAQGPYLLAGHSVGGLIAFEMARQLQKAGEQVAFLALIEPSTPDGLSRKQVAISSFAGTARRRLAALSQLNLRQKFAYASERLVNRVGKKLKRFICALYHFLEKPLPFSLKRFYVEQIVYGEIYPKARKAYAPGSYNGPVTVFKGTQGRLHAEFWRQFVSGKVEICEVPGDHLTMIEAPHVYVLAERLAMKISKACDR